MSEKFTLIVNEKLEQKKSDHAYKVARLNKLWNRQYQNSILQAMEKNKGLKIADYPQQDLMKIACTGIKFICSLCDVRRENERLKTGYKQSLNETKALSQLIDAIFIMCGHLKLKNFVTTFPITKEYDGAKWECKDYFYTMEVLSGMDWDKPIGREGLSELLWDYQNDDLHDAYIEYTSAMSDIYRSQTGKGIMESFLEKEGISTYLMDRETGIMKNNQTGEIVKLGKKPSHLKILK
ncbi:hypothetical protein [Lacrimispora indolis]|uniref:hypothetical protein n=1 Tax=Lacrimispora indolis TaxID=69825 RepID=UPI00040CBA52|nr:hypothetical protein [[Clostridium] methoxybenzovorans]